MKKILLLIFGLIFLAAAIWAFVFYWKNFRGIGPAIQKPDEDITYIIETNETPLTLPENFSISVFADNLPGARVLAMDLMGNLWVSQTSEGLISLLEVKDGMVVSRNEVFRNLKKPHGLAIDPKDPFMLYFAEEDKISRVRLYSEGGMEMIVGLPGGGRHFTRTLGFGPDDRLYVSIGSSCDVCETDAGRARIFSMNRDGSDFKEVAKGLRNSVFFTWSYVDGRMWATEMGRDFLGDDLPPDEVNIIEEGKNYGWPTCYGKNIHDTVFDKKTYIRNPCMEPFETSSYIDIPAHSSPLGLAFVPEEGWPEEYWYDLLVAYHGSWNRSTPTGYKIARFILDEHGNYSGVDSTSSPQVEDFITGWLTKEGGALGRPVDILSQPGGIMYVSDDKAGVIYKIVYENKI